MSPHRYQNEIAQLIIVRNTASFKKSYNEGQAAGCSRCKCDRRDSNPSHQNGASLITAMLQLFVKGLLCQTLHFCCLIDHIAVKSAGTNPAKAGPGRGVQYNAHSTSKTWVTLNGRKNSIPSQIYSSTSCNCLPNWPGSPESDASQDCQVSIWRSRLQFHEFQLILLLLPHVWDMAAVESCFVWGRGSLFLSSPWIGLRWKWCTNTP